MVSRLCANDKLEVTSNGVYDFCMRARTHFLPNSDTFPIVLRWIQCCSAKFIVAGALQGIFAYW